jgi:hypothetical protein
VGPQPKAFRKTLNISDLSSYEKENWERLRQGHGSDGEELGARPNGGAPVEIKGQILVQEDGNVAGAGFHLRRRPS